MGRMNIFRLLCGFGLLALLASNIWTMSRWSESRGVYDDVCYLRQAHLFQKFASAVSTPTSSSTTTTISRTS